MLDLDGLAKQIKELVDRRNTAGFDWEAAVAETEIDDAGRGVALPERASFGDVAPGTRRSMIANRRRDTSPEKAVRSLLHARGLRFRVDYPIPTAKRSIRVDIAFPREKLAILIDGCFWHGCPEHGTMPKHNRDYWEPKIADPANRERDLRQVDLLSEAGWLATRYWTHESPDEHLRSDRREPHGHSPHQHLPPDAEPLSPATLSGSRVTRIA